jgi:DNA-binding phage protein
MPVLSLLCRLGTDPWARPAADAHEDWRNTYVTATLVGMATPRTGAERYLAKKLEDPEYRVAYEQARERIDQIDLVIRALDERRTELNLTKADLARRAGVKPEAIRRLFSAENPNPTLSTLVALAGALDLELRPEPRRAKKPATPARSSGSGTRRRTA